MYNISTLIQEIQLLRGSFRIYVLIAHGSAPLGTGTKTRQLGGGGRAPGPLWAGYSGLCPVLIISPGQDGHFIAGWNLVLKRNQI